MTKGGSDDLAKGNGSADVATAAKFAKHYFRLTDGRREWLSVHLAQDATTPFGAHLLRALTVIDARLVPESWSQCARSRSRAAFQRSPAR